LICHYTCYVTQNNYIWKDTLDFEPLQPAMLCLHTCIMILIWYELIADTKKCQNGFHVKAYTFYPEINTKTLHFSHFVRSISTFHWPISAYYQTFSNLGRHFRFGIIRPLKHLKFRDIFLTICLHWSLLNLKANFMICVACTPFPPNICMCF